MTEHVASCVTVLGTLPGHAPLHAAAADDDHVGVVAMRELDGTSP